jgi:flagellin
MVAQAGAQVFPREADRELVSEADRWQRNMVINTNLSAQSSARLLAQSSGLLAKSLARLSSGSKITSPEDDAAGLAVSLRFDAGIHRLEAVEANVGNAISFSQTQDGYLDKVGQAYDRMSELAVLAQDVTKTDADRALYQTEYSTLGSYILNVMGKDFNGISLFSSSPLIVVTDSDGGTFGMSGINMVNSNYTGCITGCSLSSAASASAALVNTKSALTRLASDRASVGANLCRLNYTSEQLAVLRDNLAAANSRIRDVDVADESTQYARYNILVQAGTAMLAQANAAPQSVLRLLQ